jgi:alpha-glucosidase
METFSAELFKDGINASSNAEDYKVENVNVTSRTKIEAKLATGGGWAAIIKRK